MGEVYFSWNQGTAGTIDWALTHSLHSVSFQHKSWPTPLHRLQLAPRLSSWPVSHSFLVFISFTYMDNRTFSLCSLVLRCLILFGLGDHCRLAACKRNFERLIIEWKTLKKWWIFYEWRYVPEGVWSPRRRRQSLCMWQMLDRAISAPSRSLYQSLGHMSKLVRTLVLGAPLFSPEILNSASLFLHNERKTRNFTLSLMLLM